MDRPLGVKINGKHSSIEEGYCVAKKRERIWLGSKIEVLDVNNRRQDKVLYT